MDRTGPTEHFVRELTLGQNSVFAYILSLVGNPDTARDILQNTNVVLWRKADTFKEGTRFISWALAVARLEVMAYRRDHHRDRHVFDEGLLGQMADEFAADATEPTPRQQAFEQCLEQLTERQRKLLSDRYATGGSVTAMAEARGQSAGALSVTLTRIRKALATCIENKASGGAAS